MKKLFLLLMGGVIALNVNAQNRKSSILLNNDMQMSIKAGHLDHSANAAVPNHNAAKTTGPGGSRWYNYGDSVLSLKPGVPGVLNFTGFNLWNDTTALMGYMNGTTPTYSTSNFVSVGLSFDPFYYGWNDSSLFVGHIKIAAANAYTIDSVAIVGSYGRSSNPTKVSVVDTLRLGFVYGNGSGSSNLPTYFYTGMASHYGVDTVRTLVMMHDSVNNHADKNVSTAPAVYLRDIYLGATDSATNWGGVFPVSFPVPAGKNYASMSLTFKSGDASYVPFDTVQYANESYKYHDFSINRIASGTSGTAISYPPYDANDHTVGFFKRHTLIDGGNDQGAYTPHWAWSPTTGSGGSALQYPFIVYHVTCATCDLITNTVSVNNLHKDIVEMSAYPNPANNEVTISFSLANRSDVSIELTNTLGQVVSTQQSANILNGTATVNTSALPSGVYFYTIIANGDRRTGRVAVSH